jgi:hypothetical protein
MTIDFNQPQVAAAVVGGCVAAVVSLIVAVVNQFSLRSMHRQRLASDEKQAERRTTAEITLTERKITADITLAEKKFPFDKALVVWRRRYDLAEQVLTTAYELRDALTWARAPVGFSGEGETRTATESESDKLKRKRDSYYIPAERLTRDTKSFSTLQTLRYPVAAHFGSDTVKPLGAITEVYHGITTAAGILVQLVQDDDDQSVNQSIAPLLEALGRRPRPDSTDKKINDAIEQIEAVCKPVLSAMPPT